MGLIIREAKLSDVSAIHKLNVEELKLDYPVKMTRQKLVELLASERDKILVGVLDGIVIGYIHASSYDLLCSPPIKNIMSVAVSSTCGVVGLGRHFMERIEQWAAETGAVGVRVTSDKARIDANSYYKDLGYGDPQPQLYYKKTL